MIQQKKGINNKDIMIWGMIGYNGGIGFCRVKGNLSAESYISQILDIYVKTNQNLKCD